MSSFIGHAITAGGVFVSRKDARKDFSWKGGVWLGWMMMAAIAPDLDYFVPFLHKGEHDGLRISHSIGFALILPAATVGVLAVCKVRGRQLVLRAIQITLASLSHILLDFLVGVHPMPLLWPLADSVFRSLVGLLPSAGALSLTNHYFYRNLAIELGVLVPIFAIIRLFLRGRLKSRKLLLAALSILSAGCMFLAYGLSRG